MSEEVELDEFLDESEGEPEQEWRMVRLEEVAQKRSKNVDPQEVNLERHVGLEHIDPNTPYPKWDSVGGLSSTKRRFESGDILFAKLRPNLEKSAQPDFEGVASTDIFPIVGENGVNSKYLLYRLSSKPAYDYARRTSAGTRMPRTSWNLFSKFEFSLPPLEEQRKIATVLHNVDQAIQKTERIIQHHNKLKRILTQDLLNKGVVECDREVKRVGPKEVEIPEYWEVKKVSEISSIKNGNRIVKGHNYADSKTEYPFIRIVNIDSGTVSTDNIKNI